MARKQKKKREGENSKKNSEVHVIEEKEMTVLTLV